MLGVVHCGLGPHKLVVVALRKQPQAAFGYRGSGAHRSRVFFHFLAWVACDEES